MAVKTGQQKASLLEGKLWNDQRKVISQSLKPGSFYCCKPRVLSLSLTASGMMNYHMGNMPQVIQKTN